MDETRGMNFYCNDDSDPTPNATPIPGSGEDVSPRIRLEPPDPNGSIKPCNPVLNRVPLSLNKVIGQQEARYNLNEKILWNFNPNRDHYSNSNSTSNSSSSSSNYFSLRVRCCRALDIFAIKRPLWIQLLILFLIILPSSPGTQVNSEAAPQPRPLPLQPRVPYFNYSNSHSLSSLTAGFSIPGTISAGGSTSSKGNLPTFTSNRSEIVTTTSTSSTSTSTSGEALLDGDYPFENNTYSNTTVPLGDTAFLKCSVRNLGERSVFWIRRRDMHIISVGKNIYTNDERFHILNFEGSDDWVLQIKYVQKRDNGTYECQVSTGKGIASYAVHVFVAVPEAFILGNGEYHIQEKSTINLVCIVEKSPKPPDFIFWYHNDRMINYDKDRNLRIQTETGSKTHSRLIIDNAQVSDSGNYTCQAGSNAEPASTLVYISQGDKMAAIQRRKSAALSTYFSDYFPLLHQLLSILLLLLIN